MKKIWVPIVLVCYLAVSSGVVVNFHYCMKRLASVEYFSFQGERCEKCGMAIHQGIGCCHDEVKVVKMDSDQKVTSAIAFELPSLDVVPSVPSEFIAAAFENDLHGGNYSNHSPPLLGEQDTYLQIRVFRL